MTLLYSSKYPITMEIFSCYHGDVCVPAVVVVFMLWNLISLVYMSPLLSLNLRYLHQSQASPFPWASCANAWNTDRCQEIVPLSQGEVGNGTSYDYRYYTCYNG